MATRTLNIPLPIKGIDISKPAEYVDRRGASNIKNMSIDRGTIRKRYGTGALGASLGERVMNFFELEVGSTTRLIRVGLTKVEDFNKATETWADIAHASLTGSSSDNVHYALPLLSGTKLAVFTNGIDEIRKVTTSGNDALLGGSPPKAKFLVSFGGYLVLAYVIDAGTTHYQRVQWSDTGDIETWSGGNTGSTNLLEDPGNITGMEVWKDYILVHKENSIYIGGLVSTRDVFRFDRLATGAGCAEGASRTIVNLPTGEQFFYSKSGLRVFNGTTAPLVPGLIQDEIRDSVNPEYLHTAWAVLMESEDEVWCALPTGVSTEPNTIYKYNYGLGQIYKDERSNISAVGLYKNTSESTWNDLVGDWASQNWRWNSVINLSLAKILALGNTSGVTTRRNGSSSDNGTAIDGVWDTKDFTAQDFGIKEIDAMLRFQGLEVWAVGNSVKVYYSTNSGSSWNLITTLTLSSVYPSDESPLNCYFDVVSSKIRFRFQNNTDAQSFTLKKYQIEAVPRERRK